MLIYIQHYERNAAIPSLSIDRNSSLQLTRQKCNRNESHWGENSMPLAFFNHHSTTAIAIIFHIIISFYWLPVVVNYFYLHAIFYYLQLPYLHSSIWQHNLPILCSIQSHCSSVLKWDRIPRVRPAMIKVSPIIYNRHTFTKFLLFLRIIRTKLRALLFSINLTCCPVRPLSLRLSPLRGKSGNSILIYLL